VISFTVRPLYLSAKEPLVLIGQKMLRRSQSRSGSCGVEKTFLYLPRIEPRPFGQCLIAISLSYPAPYHYIAMSVSLYVPCKPTCSSICDFMYSAKEAFKQSFVNEKIAVDGMGEANNTHGSDDKCTQNIDREV
jgi:hypothetical protein